MLADEARGILLCCGEVPGEVAYAATWVHPRPLGEVCRLLGHEVRRIIRGEVLPRSLAARAVRHGHERLVAHADLADRTVFQRVAPVNGAADTEVCGDCFSEIGALVRGQCRHCPDR